MTGFGSLLTGHTLVGRYRIQSVIGRGGFAVVYDAHDERLDRPVAVKVITLGGPEGTLERELQARFEREARASAALQHRNVVNIFDFGTDPKLGLDFLVMERLRGEDLRTRLRRADPLPLEGALHILASAAGGVAAGHQAGIIHRDVKPANIFLTVSPEVRHFRVCVLDFGIALLAAADDTSRLTRNGIPLSVPYAAPEQLMGSVDLTPAADVFGLGAVGYEVLARRRPFTGGSTRALEERNNPPPPLAELNREVPPHVAAAIHRALDPDPEARFPDARAFERALEGPVLPLVISAVPNTPVETVPIPFPVPPAGPVEPVPPVAPVESAPQVAPAAPVASAPRAEPTRPAAAAAAPRSLTDRPTRRWAPIAALAGILAVAGIGGAMLLGGGDDDEPPLASRTTEAAGAVAALPDRAGDGVADSVVPPASTAGAGAAQPAAAAPRAAATAPAAGGSSPARTAPAASDADRPTVVRRTTPAAPPAAPPARREPAPAAAPSGPEFRENLSHRCQSVSPPTEATACLRRDLAAADQELNSVYRSVMSRLDRSRRDALRENQRAWLRRYDAVITSYYSTDWGDHSLVQVLPSQIRALRDRTAYLRSVEGGAGIR